jgi:hypothetical protein
MNPVELYDDKFFKILWNEADRVIGIDWKETTASMTDEDFKGELELFVGRVEEKKARGIIIDVKHFRHKLGPGMQEWRVKNISTATARPALRVSPS